jgi:hypothetical protein
MVHVREALERSWSPETAYEGASRPGLPAFGQCYPTARVLQVFFPALEIVEGIVWTGTQAEKHFRNVLVVADLDYHLDLTWQQFPAGSDIREWRLRARESLNDGPATVERVDLLLRRVRAHLEAHLPAG